MKLAIVLGTRPEIIKMSPIIRECRKRQLDYIQIHTGQHYSFELDKAFFNDLKLPEPDYNLEVGSGSHAVQTGKIMAGIEEILQKENLDMVLVQGDTNTVLAASLAAVKLGVPIGHVEAGLRSYDRSMPEEINRIISDQISSLLFTPTIESRENLLSEGIYIDNIHVTGNTVTDAVFQNLELAENNRDTLEKLGLDSGNYFLLTCHRAENTDDANRLQSLIHGIQMVQAKYRLPVVFSVHPRTKKMLQQYHIDTDQITLIEPVGYLDFLALERNAKLILTDSGGVQEEACILGTPCVTLRENTERPETLTIGVNILAGTESVRILEAVELMLGNQRDWENPYGDGRAAEKIITVVTSYVEGWQAPDQIALPSLLEQSVIT
ncbi:UDP-N-acetylglucosamine 2-epimerase (non-hydrolyzing) [archaeon]|nr:UDP-N-acetylglucosamine 2-epimerase (non-hydrolyzing) [archaeon]